MTLDVAMEAEIQRSEMRLDVGRNTDMKKRDEEQKILNMDRISKNPWLRTETSLCMMLTQPLVLLYDPADRYQEPVYEVYESVCQDH